MSTQISEIPKRAVLLDVGGAFVGAVLAYYANKMVFVNAPFNTTLTTYNGKTFTYGTVASFGVAALLILIGMKRMKILSWVGLGWLMSDTVQMLIYLGV